MLYIDVVEIPLLTFLMLCLAVTLLRLKKKINGTLRLYRKRAKGARKRRKNPSSLSNEAVSDKNLLENVKFHAEFIWLNFSIVQLV